MLPALSVFLLLEYYQAVSRRWPFSMRKVVVFSAVFLLIFYAWNPLVVAEVSASAHHDVLVIAALLAAANFSLTSRPFWTWNPQQEIGI
jgi:hypothetical protein